MDLRDLERRSGGGVAAAASPFCALRGGDGGEGAISAGRPCAGAGGAICEERRRQDDGSALAWIADPRRRVSSGARVRPPVAPCVVLRWSPPCLQCADTRTKGTGAGVAAPLLLLPLPLPPLPQLAASRYPTHEIITAALILR